MDRGANSTKYDKRWATRGLRGEQADVAWQVIRTLGYGNWQDEPVDADSYQDGRDDSAWVAMCLDLLGKWIASVYHDKPFTSAGQRVREHRGEVGYTG